MHNVASSLTGIKVVTFEVYNKHGQTPENVCRLHIIADKFGYLQVRKLKILISAPKKPGFAHAWCTILVKNATKS